MAPTTTHGADVVIAGAGIAGIALAHRLSVHHRAGRVVLVDPRPPLTLTSDKTGANYREWWPVPAMVQLARRSIQLMDTIATADASLGMNRRGYLYVTTDPAGPDRVAKWIEPYERAGLGPVRRHENPSAYRPGPMTGLAGPGGADLLGSALIRQSFPHLSPAVTAGLHARVAGSIDTVALGRFLLAAARARGVELLRGTVTAVPAGDRRVREVTVTTDDGAGRIATPVFVNAAGPFAGDVSRLISHPLPLENILQQKVTFADPHGALPPDAPFTITLDPVASVPAGLHIKRDIANGQPVIKVGCALNQVPEEPEWEPRRSDDFADRVLRAAAEIIPGIRQYVAANAREIGRDAGYYTRTPDELPLIGPAGPEGCFVSAGYAGFGAMVACAAAEIAAGWITGTASSPLAQAFRPGRFAESPARVPGAVTGAL